MKHKNQLDISVITTSAAPLSTQPRVRFTFINFDIDPDLNDASKCQPLNLSSALKQPKPYDPHDDGKTDNPTSFLGTIFHILMIVAGPAMLSLPSAFVAAGYVVTIVLVPTLVCLYAYTVSLMVSSAYTLCKRKRISNLSYTEATVLAFAEGPKFGRWFAKCGRQLSLAVFFAVWFGFCCYDYVVICENLQVLVENIFHVRAPIDAFLVLLLVPLILLSWIPTLNYLVPFSILGSVFNAVCSILIVYYIFTDPRPWVMPAAVGPLSSVPLLMGSTLFSLNFTGIMISLKNEMEKPKQFSSGCGVLALTFGLTSVLYTFFSLMCVLKYGNSVQSSVIRNIPANQLAAQIGILLSSLALLFQYPLVMYVPYEIFYNQLLKTRQTAAYKMVWEYALRTSLVVVSFMAAATVPNIFLFLSLSGTVCTSVDSLIMPALVHTAVTWKTCDSRIRFSMIFIKNMAIVTLALILVVAGFRDCVSQISNYHSDENDSVELGNYV